MIAFYNIQNTFFRYRNKHQLDYDLICDTVLQDKNFNVDSSDFSYLLQFLTTSFCL